MIHPRDWYAQLEGIWLSYNTYLAKRLPLEQVMIDHGQEDIENLISYLNAEIKRRQKDIRKTAVPKFIRELDDMRRINTIAKEILEDYV